VPVRRRRRRRLGLGGRRATTVGGGEHRGGGCAPRHTGVGQRWRRRPWVRRRQGGPARARLPWVRRPGLRRPYSRRRQGGLPELACPGCSGLGSGGPARGGGGSRRRGLAVCPADTRGPQEIEVRVYFPAGVDMQCCASIFWS
jgi:hypothetical protein